MDGDIFGSGEDSQPGGWEDEVNPQLFTSANIFLPTPSPGDCAGAGAPALGGTDDVLADLFGPQGALVGGTGSATVGTTSHAPPPPPPPLTSERGAPVS